MKRSEIFKGKNILVALGILIFIVFNASAYLLFRNADSISFDLRNYASANVKIIFEELKNNQIYMKVSVPSDTEFATCETLRINPTGWESGKLTIYPSKDNTFEYRSPALPPSTGKPYTYQSICQVCIGYACKPISPSAVTTEETTKSDTPSIPTVTIKSNEYTLPAIITPPNPLKCEAPTPYIWKDPSTGKEICVECTQDSHCPNAKCDLTKHYCVAITPPNPPTVGNPGKLSIDSDPCLNNPSGYNYSVTLGSDKYAYYLVVSEGINYPSFVKKNEFVDASSQKKILGFHKLYLNSKDYKSGDPQIKMNLYRTTLSCVQFCESGMSGNPSFCQNCITEGVSSGSKDSATLNMVKKCFSIIEPPPPPSIRCSAPTPYVWKDPSTGKDICVECKQDSHCKDGKKCVLDTFTKVMQCGYTGIDLGVKIVDPITLRTEAHPQTVKNQVKYTVTDYSSKIYISNFTVTVEVYAKNTGALVFSQSKTHSVQVGINGTQSYNYDQTFDKNFTPMENYKIVVKLSFSDIAKDTNSVNNTDSRDPIMALFPDGSKCVAPKPYAWKSDSGVWSCVACKTDSHCPSGVKCVLDPINKTMQCGYSISCKAPLVPSGDMSKCVCGLQCKSDEILRSDCTCIKKSTTPVDPSKPVSYDMEIVNPEDREEFKVDQPITLMYKFLSESEYDSSKIVWKVDGKEMDGEQGLIVRFDKVGTKKIELLYDKVQKDSISVQIVEEEKETTPIIEDENESFLTQYGWWIGGILCCLILLSAILAGLNLLANKSKDEEQGGNS